MNDMRSHILDRMSHLQDLTEKRLDLVTGTLKRVAETKPRHVPEEDLETIQEAIVLLEHSRRLAEEAMTELHVSAPRQWSIMVQALENLTAGMLLGCTRGFLNKSSENLPKHRVGADLRRKRAVRNSKSTTLIRGAISDLVKDRYGGLTWPTQWALAESIGTDLRADKGLRRLLTAKDTAKISGSKGGLSTTAIDRHLAQMFESEDLLRSALIRSGEI